MREREKLKTGVCAGTIDGLLFFLKWCALLVLLSSCSAPRTGGTLSVASPEFFGFAEDLADQLVENNRTGGGAGQRLILTSFVNLDDLYETSGFGRALTESLSNALFRRGFQVAEIRKSSGLYIKRKGGELVLTRDAGLIAEQEDAQALSIGTYSLTPSTVIVNVKLVATESSDVLSVGWLEIQRSRNINYLLADRSGLVTGPLSAYER